MPPLSRLAALFLAPLQTLRKKLDRWMLDTRDLGPEADKAYEANLAFELRTGSEARKQAMLENIARMKRWAEEGK